MKRSVALLLGFLLLMLAAVPVAEGQLGRRLYLPVVPRDSTPTATPTPQPTATPVAPIQIRYRAWTAADGWLPWQMSSPIKDQGGIAGTMGLVRPIEAIQLELLNAPAGANLRYRVHVSFEGWLDWGNTGAVAGKPGEGKQIEAIQIGLENVPNVYVSSQVFVKDWGWLGYVRDFWQAGTTKQQRRVEAYRIYVRSGSPEPADVQVSYSVNLQDKGWTDWFRSNELAGTTGEQRRLQAMRVMLYNKPEFMDVEYIVAMEGSSWGAWTRDAGVAGVPDGGRSIYAFQMRYISPYEGSHINYQGHFQDRGTLGPVQDGAVLGNPDDPNERKRLEAIRVYATHDRP